MTLPDSCEPLPKQRLGGWAGKKRKHETWQLKMTIGHLHFAICLQRVQRLTQGWRSFNVCVTGATGPTRRRGPATQVSQHAEVIQTCSTNRPKMLPSLLMIMIVRKFKESFEFGPVSSTCAAAFCRDLLPEPTAAPSWNAPGSAWSGFAGWSFPKLSH